LRGADGITRGILYRLRFCSRRGGKCYLLFNPISKTGIISREFIKSQLAIKIWLRNLRILSTRYLRNSLMHELGSARHADARSYPVAVTVSDLLENSTKKLFPVKYNCPYAYLQWYTRA